MTAKLQCGMRVVVATDVHGAQTGTIEEITVLGEGERRAELVRVLLDVALPPVCSCGLARCRLDVHGPTILRTTAAADQVQPLVLH